MTPKEKAKELVDKFYDFVYYGNAKYDAKECALIAADEILKENLEELLDEPETVVRYIYWQEVKKEIQAL